MANNNNPIVVEQFFPVSSAKLWQAITVVDEMTQWFFENIPDFKAEKGFYTEFPIHSEGRIFTHEWTILEVIPEKKIVYDWRYPEYSGIARIDFELIEENNGTTLRLSNYGLDSFPKEIPEFSEESCRGGWNYFIKERLKDYLNKL